MTLRVAELETLMTADIRPFEQGAKAVETRAKAIDGKVTTAKVDADVRSALASIDKVEDKARSTDAEIKVDADTSAAEDAIEGLGDKAEGAGADGGKRGGDALAAGIVGALATIPIAGAVVGIADTVAKSVIEGFQAGLAVEVRADRLAATTGLDEAAVGRLARAAGESYADNFGESIEQNMTTARTAVQTGLLDPAAVQRDAQQVISSVSGVADIVEEDAARIARSSAQLIRTGLAKNADEAFDIIVAGQQAGLNASEDWLDTLDEYSTQFRKLGIDGGETLGLLSQAVQAGARDTDIAADALKEFSIRAVDGSALTAEGFDAIGLSADDMADRISRGGETARDALDETLDGLRRIENPAERTAAAVALFGTQAEDLGDALFALDLDTAARQFEDLEGRAARALATLGDNSASELAKAQRGIDVAVEGIQGALAAAFGDEITEAAEFISQNREAVTQFLLDVANGAIDMGRAFVESAAAGTEAFGDFAGDTLPGILEGIDAIVQGLRLVNQVSAEDAAEFSEWTDTAVQNLADFDKSTEQTADNIRRNLIENGLDPAQEKLNEFGEKALADARLSDATNELADDIAAVGFAADGSKLSLGKLDGEIDTTTKSGKRLDRQIREVKDGLLEQVSAAAQAGESTASLRDRARDARTAFIDQVEAMGATRAEAEALADEYGLVPREIVTTVKADVSPAKRSIADILATPDIVIGVDVERSGYYANRAGGGPIVGPGTGTSDDVPILASNGEHMLTASDVEKAGGHGAVYRMRAMIQAGMARFASGGAVGAASRDVRRRQRDLERAQDQLRRAQGTSREDSAENAVDRAEAQLDAARDRLARLREERREVSTGLRRGEFGGDLSTVDQLLDLSRSGDLSRGQSRRLAGVAGDAERALARLEREAGRVEKRLEGARDRMEELRGISERVSGGLIGEFSLRDAAAPTTTNQFGETIAADASASGIVGAAKRVAARLLAFRDKIRALRRAGLRGRALDEIAQLPSEQGIEVADAFLADRAQIGELNTALRDLDAAGAGVGQAVTEGFFRGGLSRAEALVAAGERDQAALDRAYDRIGERMGRAIAKELGIKARAGGGPVTAGSAYLVNENTPNSELFVANQNGAILNRAQMAGLGATFTDAQIATLARAVRDGAAAGLAGHEQAQDRAAMYVGGL